MRVHTGEEVVRMQQRQVRPMSDYEADANGPMSDEFIRLLSQHQSQLFGYIFCMVRSLPDTEDVFQQTAVVLWNKFDDFTPGTSFVAWAKCVARNNALP